MTKRLDETIGTFAYENLIFDTSELLVTRGKPIDAGQGLLMRGTLVGENKTTGKVAIYNGDSGGSVMIAGIISDDIDTGTVAGSTLMAMVYTRGSFAENHLIIKEGYTLTNEDRNNLLKLGISLGKSA